MWSFVTGFSHLACFHSSFMLQRVSVHHLLLWMNNILYMNTPYFVYPFITWYISSSVGLFPTLTIMNNAAMELVYKLLHIFISLGYMPRSGIAGSYSNSVFNHVEELPDCFGTIFETKISSSNIKCFICYNKMELIFLKMSRDLNLKNSKQLSSNLYFHLFPHPSLERRKMLYGW